MTEKTNANHFYQFGDQYALKLKLDMEIKKDLEKYQSQWSHYNSKKPHIRRYAISVFNETGTIQSSNSLESLNTIHFNDFKIQESDYNKPTEIYKNSNILQSFFSDMSSWCVKTFFLKLPSGGFFPPHRDQTMGTQESFRLVVPIANYNPPNFHFMIDGKSLFWEQGQLYVINTTKQHSLFNSNVTKDSLWLIITGMICYDSFQFVVKNLQ